MKHIKIQTSKTSYSWFLSAAAITGFLLSQNALANLPNMQDVQWLQSQVTGGTELSAEDTTNPGDKTFKAFYTIDDSQNTPRGESPARLEDPVEVLFDSISALEANVEKATGLNLLKWIKHNAEIEPSPEAYNRKKHFGTWVRDNTGSCQNTRTKVLVRDSAEPVKFKDVKKCAVESGQWLDPYSNSEYTDPREIQIDHVVPLKNAWDNGAWRWDNKKRCLYGNFLANPYHLLAVYGPENASKGASGPEKYIPPNTEYICSYVQIWLKIKLTWNLIMTPPESQAIADAIKQYNCKDTTYKMSRTDLEKQRKDMSELVSICD